MGFIKKYWKCLLIFIVVFLFVIPLGIHCCFKFDCRISFFQAEWSAGEVLAFYGGIVASIATVFGVYLSIQYSQSIHREDVRNSVLPFMIITPFLSKTKWRPDISAHNKEEMFSNEYQEYKLEKVFFIIKNGGVTARSALDQEQIERVEYGGQCWAYNEKNGEYHKEYYNIGASSLEVENVGKGTAVLFRIGFNSMAIPKSKWVYLEPMSLKVGQTLYVGIYCEDGESSAGEYVLDLVYEDVYGNQYGQGYNFFIKKMERLHSLSIGIDMKGLQKRIR